MAANRHFDKLRQVQRFSLRKLGVGVVSVLLGTTFFTVLGANPVQADAQESVKTEQVESAKDESKTEETAEVKAQDVKTTDEGGKKDADQTEKDDKAAEVKEDKPVEKSQSEVFSEDLKQNLEIQDELNGTDPEKRIKLEGSDNVGKIFHKGDDHYGVKTDFTLNTNVDKDSVIKVTYTDLEKSKFDGQDIHSATYTFSKFEPCYENQGMSLKAHDNINAGFDMYNVKNVKVDVQLFSDYDQKDPIQFSAAKPGYFVVSSLNHYQKDNRRGRHVERVRVLNDSAKVLELAGSEVALHEDGYIYADKDIENIDWYNAKDEKWTNAKKRNGDWDRNAEGTYVGSALAEVTKSHLEIEFGMDASQNPEYLWNWARLVTVLPKNTFPVPDAPEDKPGDKTKEEKKARIVVNYVGKDGQREIPFDNYQYNSNEQDVIERAYPKDGELKTVEVVNFDTVSSPEIKGYKTDTDAVTISGTLDQLDKDDTISVEEKDGVYVITKTVYYTKESHDGNHDEFVITDGDKGSDSVDGDTDTDTDTDDTNTDSGKTETDGDKTDDNNDGKTETDGDKTDDNEGKTETDDNKSSDSVDGDTDDDMDTDTDTDTDTDSGKTDNKGGNTETDDNTTIIDGGDINPAVAPGKTPVQPIDLPMEVVKPAILVKPIVVADKTTVETKDAAQAELNLQSAVATVKETAGVKASAAVAPKAESAKLPQTGEKQNKAGFAALVLAAASLLLGAFGKRKQD